MTTRKPIRKSISGVIAGRMRENALTPMDLEKDFGMSAKTIYRRLEIPDNLTLGELRRICRRLDISVDEARPYLW